MVDYASYLNQYRGQAQQQADAQVQPQLNELMRQIQQAQAEGQRQQQEAQQFGTTAVGDIGELFRRAIEAQQQGQQDQIGRYNTASTEIGNNYNSGIQGVLARYGQAQDNSNAELNRLGIGGGPTDVNGYVNGRMNADKNWLTGLMDVNRTNDQASTGRARDDFSSYMQAMMGATGAESAAKQSVVKDNTQRQIQEILRNMNTTVGDLNGKRGDIEAQRGAIMNQLLTQLANDAYDRAFQKEQADRDYQMQQAQLALQRQAAARAGRSGGGGGGGGYRSGGGGGGSANDAMLSQLLKALDQQTIPPTAQTYGLGPNGLSSLNIKAIKMGAHPQGGV